MKNNTSFTDEEIMGIVEMTKTEYSDYPLTERKVLNIANKIDELNFANKKDKLLALEYTARLRCETLFHTELGVPFDKRGDYYNKQFITIDAMTARVYSTLYPGEKNDLLEINDEEIKKITDRVLCDLKLELDSKTESLENIQKSTIVRKNIIKKRLGF